MLYFAVRCVIFVADYGAYMRRIMDCYKKFISWCKIQHQISLLL